MIAADLVRYATDALFVLVFLATLAAALRERRRPLVDAALLFGSLAIVLVQGEVTRALGVTLPAAAADLSAALVVAVPYLLLRVVDDLVGVRREVLAAALIGLVAVVAGLFVLGTPLPGWFTLTLIAYFVALQLYASALLYAATRRSSGVPRQRSRAAVLGSVLLGAAVLVAGLQMLLGPLESVTRLLALGSALAYYAAFAPPRQLKRAWEEPELRSFLDRLAAVSPDLELPVIAARLEAAVALASGASAAMIGLWDEERAALVLPADGSAVDGVLAQAYREQRACVRGAGGGATAPSDEPVSRATIAAPITARGRRLGALAVELRHVPLFVKDDLAFVRLLADQSALVFDSAKIYQDLAQLNRRLQDATRAKSEFLANMSHELRTPMNAILGFSELLVEQLGERLAPAQRRYFRNITDAGQHLLELINEVLDLSKVEAGKLELRRETVTLESLLEPVVSSTRTAAAARQLGLELDLPEGRAVRVDPSRVRQILYNLLSNAVKFTEPGGQIRLHAAVDGTDLRLEVADTGIGIPADRRDRVFGTFERLHEGRSSASGTGLGLALTKRLVELHGGSITFDSEDGGGTTFQVRLPGALVAPMTGARLLIVEDDPRDAELIAVVAAEVGLRSEIVGSALGAREALRRAIPIAMVLDRRLPDERSERLLEEVKANVATRSIPVVVVSVEDDDGRSVPLGADDHITKPIDRVRLAAWLRRIASGRDRARAGDPETLVGTPTGREGPA